MQKPDRPEGPQEVEPLSGPVDGERDRADLRGSWRRRSARGRALIAATTVAVLALGGTVAYAAASGGSGGGSPSASPSASSSEGPGGRHGHGGPWFGLGGDAAHGEATVKDPDTGDWVVRVWQRGTVAKVADDRVTVRSEDGVSWTWTVGADTAVSAEGASGSGADALKKGDTVHVVGSRSGGTNTADRVLSGTFDERGPYGHGMDGHGMGGRGPGDRRDDSPGHGPWNHEDDRSPGPTGSGAAT
ncbi:hypothetical protein [Streptomyces sp. Root1310]|uniref:hypothetical protein n=1 Tax=Streptomyces sp. Root1310 TaxID=1736452 RepID=UPI00070DACC7|nr:hypothetical protein [Streptomyces sp. Root1310]KQX64026.1 hypothetical protein ASD48_22075 [Streptomyces sp. Root1310]